MTATESEYQEGCKDALWWVLAGDVEGRVRERTVWLEEVLVGSGSGTWRRGDLGTHPLQPSWGPSRDFDV